MNSKKGGRGNDFPRHVSQTVGPEDRKIKMSSFFIYFFLLLAIQPKSLWDSYLSDKLMIAG